MSWRLEGGSNFEERNALGGRCNKDLHLHSVKMVGALEWFPSVCCCEDATTGKFVVNYTVAYTGYSGGIVEGTSEEVKRMVEAE